MRAGLSEAGYKELKEKDAWKVHPGGKYYVVRNGSSMIAFQVPESEADATEAKGGSKDVIESGNLTDFKGFHIVATHSDSPTFKLKEAPEILVEESYVKLNTEKYGGMILSTWMDRALSVAGRVVGRLLLYHHHRHSEYRRSHYDLLVYDRRNHPFASAFPRPCQACR